MPQDLKIVFYPSWRPRLFVVAWLIFAIPAAFFGLCDRSLAPPATNLFGLFFLVLAGLFSWELIRSIGLKVEVSGDGISQQGPLGAWSLKWQDINTWYIPEMVGPMRGRGGRNLHIKIQAKDSREFRIHGYVTDRKNMPLLQGELTKRVGKPRYDKRSVRN